ncbi:hypothetical protein D8674_017075 [Pyrus ussuriensis x Pyrus communis]|uniref:Uncharacterized protein n=1 Tax=Pyrus ussuriensis x Pyrus communis TaxID=2448454 RepID=A0A5N5HC12_9ROSA|nr:hypothetical protein D8674_017075 [Pyrus ussuriensis x Pyrus communis]
MFLRRGITFASALSPHFLSRAAPNFCCKPTTTTIIPVPDHSRKAPNYFSSFHLSSLLPSDDSKPHSDSYGVQLVDDDAWQVSSGLALAGGGMQGSALDSNALSDEVVDEPIDSCRAAVEGDPDFDDIDNMRICGSLFFKLDRDSKEFEEYNFDFHRRKKSSKQKDDPKESQRKGNELNDSKSNCELPSRSKKQTRIVDDSPLDELYTPVGKKKLRTPTYNQLTGPFHEPFCLDIFISKASVRACIIHRVTSKVVVVAHSISKDMKFDLGSTRNAAAYDDIHDVIYTPRKGERLEGKLQIVLQSIIDSGIHVKVKLKQINRKKPIFVLFMVWKEDKVFDVFVVYFFIMRHGQMG